MCPPSPPLMMTPFLGDPRSQKASWKVAKPPWIASFPRWRINTNNAKSSNDIRKPFLKQNFHLKGNTRSTTSYDRFQTMFILAIKCSFSSLKVIRSSHFKDLLNCHFLQILIHLQAVYMILSIVQFEQQDERFMCANNRFKYTFLSTIRWFIASPMSVFRKEWIYKQNWIISFFYPATFCR